MSSEVLQTRRDVDIVSILDEPKVQSHIRKMFYIGSSMYQESAFAVYESDSFSYAVSDLLVPDIEIDGPDKTYASVAERATGVDIMPLVRKEKDFDSLSEDEYAYGHDIDELAKADYVGRQQHVLSAKAQSKIAAIEQSADLGQDEKYILIEKIKQKDYKPKPNMRRDILLLVHNHPQIPAHDTGAGVQYDLGDLLVPSQADVDLMVELDSFNPGHIDMIVAKDHKGKCGGLVTGVATRQPSPSQFLSMSALKSATAQLRLLNRAGIAYQRIDFQDDGSLTSGQNQKLRSLAKLVNNQGLQV